MRYETNEEIRDSIAELTERLRQIRIERGVPEEAPEDFVEETLSFALYNRLLPFKKIAVKYASIIAEGGAPTVDLAKLEEYRLIAALLSKSKVDTLSWFAAGLGEILTHMKRINDLVNSDEYDGPTRNDLSSLSLAVSFTDMGDVYHDYQSTETFYDRKQRIAAEIEHMDFDKEYAEALAHYESIKHLL
ncbi:hypothetical protein [Paenibacillus glucanolyticus]|uniref:hypothetical protein n=1 Tax=Paenibacillus glucanolyticus TaxID=59843 RepID=UPI00096F8393|nr:hypothetical protein [Paenibacillus glucanolyticus]OMF73031.1 hypothetical protein BK142_19370 [Paenibacillus glucanolyticus]